MMLDEAVAVERLVSQVNKYAQGRANDVARGAETPRLAVLMLQKYGRGLIEAVSEIYGSPRAADPISQTLDAESEKSDPSWREHDKARWAARPADLAF